MVGYSFLIPSVTLQASLERHYSASIVTVHMNFHIMKAGSLNLFSSPLKGKVSFAGDRVLSVRKEVQGSIVAEFCPSLNSVSALQAILVSRQ